MAFAFEKFEDPKEHPDDVDFQKAIDESSAPIVLTSSLTFSEELSEASQKFPAVASGYSADFRRTERCFRL